MPEFSVIIPVYNSEFTLRKCINSVLNQSYQDFEILCCYDDCDDSSKEIILEYCNLDERIKIIQCRKRGLSGARNDGMKASSGNFILFLDSDDCFYQNAMFCIKQEFEKRTCDIVIFGADIEPANSEVSSWYYDVLCTPERFYRHFKKTALFAEKSARPFVWRNAFSASFIKKNNLFFNEDCSVGEDQVFQLCAFPLAKNGISFIKDNLYCYTCNRSGSLMDTYDKDIVFKLTGHIKMVEHVFAYWEDRNFESLSQKDISIWAVYFLAPDITSLSQKQLDLLSEPLKILFAENRISEEIVRKFPKCVRNMTLAMKMNKSCTQKRVDTYFFYLWWYLHWGGIVFMIKKILQRYHGVWEN